MADPKEFPSDKADKFVVRFPDGMRDRIKTAAETSKRSMNAQIVHMIEFYFEEMDRLETDYKAQLEYEERMRADPPSDLEPLEKLQREFVSAQSDLFSQLAAKYGITFRNILDDQEPPKK